MMKLITSIHMRIDFLLFQKKIIISVSMSFQKRLDRILDLFASLFIYQNFIFILIKIFIMLGQYCLINIIVLLFISKAE